MALFDPAVCGHVIACLLTDLALAEVMVLAHSADLFTDLSAAGDDPVFSWGGTGHPSTLPTS